LKLHSTMDDWTSGYIADVAYTFGYYPELNPLRARLAFLHAGLAMSHVETACELGYGQGLSVNVRKPTRVFMTRPSASSASGPTCRSSTSSVFMASGAGFRTRTVRSSSTSCVASSK
jgi:hypothetical protein